jgi:hypothetical protein
MFLKLKSKYMRHIKLYEEFKRNITINSNKEVEMTVRFLLKKNIKSELLQRKIREKFIEKLKPPFNFNDLTFYSFDIDFISNVPYKGKLIASEYAIKSKVAFSSDAPTNKKDLDNLIKEGIYQFLRLEEDTYFSDEVELTSVVAFEFKNS